MSAYLMAHNYIYISKLPALSLALSVGTLEACRSPADDVFKKELLLFGIFALSVFSRVDRSEIYTLICVTLWSQASHLRAEND